MKYTITRQFPLRQKMKKHGLTIEALATAVGVNKSTISRILSEKVEAKEETFIKISNYFKSL